MQHLLGGHLVRHHQHHPIALGAPHQGQPQASVAGGGLDYGAAGLEPAITLGAVDHGDADAVLDRTAGVLGFELQEQGAEAGIEAGDPDQRSVADQVEDCGTNIFDTVHGVTSLRDQAGGAKQAPHAGT
ncbi:hypothetical protein D9M68_814060 [compost metagenome]